MKIPATPTWALVMFAVLDWILATNSFLIGNTALGVFLGVAGVLCVLAILFRP